MGTMLIRYSMVGEYKKIWIPISCEYIINKIIHVHLHVNIQFLDSRIYEIV